MEELNKQPTAKIVCSICKEALCSFRSHSRPGMCCGCEKEIYTDSINRFQKARPVEVIADEQLQQLGHIP